MNSLKGFCIFSCLMAMLLPTATAMAADPISQTLAPTGKLRAALYPGTPTSILDPKEAEPRGVGYEIGKALAARLGVPYEPVVYAKNAEVLAAIKAGKADVAFTNATASRKKDMDFGPVYMLIEKSYLVPSGSPIKSFADIDQKGRRIGVTAKSSTDRKMSSDLKNAEVVRAATNAMGAEMLASGQIDAFATNKPTLFKLAENIPGAHVLPGSWDQENHAIAVPQGRGQGAAFIKDFTNEALSSGLVKSAMDRAGLKGAIPARPDK